jgi:hypothetical protein
MTYRFAAVKCGSSVQLVDPDRKTLFKEISGRAATELRALALHEVDLRFCKSCLEELRKLNYEIESERAEAFWISCITRFYKCFGGSKARSRLSVKKIFGTSESTEAFEFFRALRNKHIVHDENPFSDAHVVVAVHQSGDGENAVNVFASPIHLFLIGDAEIERVRRLVDITLDWVTDKHKRLEEMLTAEYRQWPREKLLALPDLIITSPDMGQVYVTRAPRGSE